MNSIFSRAYIQFYSKYTGIGSKSKLTNEQKVSLFKKLIDDSKALRASETSSNSWHTDINSSILEDYELVED